MNLRPAEILDIARRAGRELHRDSGGESAIKCPYADRHQHDDVHPSCRLNPEKNTWYCDVCKAGGGIVDLAKKLGVELPRAAKTKATSSRTKPKERKLPLVFGPRGPVSPETARVFQEHLGKGYTPETWAAFGVLEGVIHPEGLPDQAEEAVAFRMPESGVHAYRYRRKDKRKRWCFANGGKSGLLTVGLERDGVVLLCEGEWDAMRAYELGLEPA
jgi:hypothetical protein